MESILVASDDRTPSLRTALAGLLNGVSDDHLVGTIGNVPSDLIGYQLREAGFDVEFRDLDSLVSLIEDRCRIGSDFSAIVLSTVRPYRGMNARLKAIARKVRGLDDQICLSSGVRVKNIPIVIGLSLEMAGIAEAPADGRFDPTIPWCTVRRPGRSFAREVAKVIREWRRDVYLQLDYVGYALGFNERGEIEISPVLRRNRRASHLFSEAASPHSLGEGGMVLVPQALEEQMASLLMLREICGNLPNIASRAKCSPELVVHQFLDQHPEILYRGEFERHWSEKVLAPRTRPDFVLSGSEVESNQQHWEVLELKRPDELVIRKRDFSRAVVQGFEQLRRYRDALSTKASRDRQERVLGSALVTPRMCLLIGRSLDADFAAEVREAHEASGFNDISLVLYDELAHPLWRRVRGLHARLLDQTKDL
jgi:hypothetical protein